MPVLSTFADLSARGNKNSQGFVSPSGAGFSTVATKATGTTIANTLAFSVTAGQLIIAFFAWDPSGASIPTIGTPTDTVGTTYVSMGAQVVSPATTSSGTGTISQCFYGIAQSTNASNIVTATLSATTTNRMLTTSTWNNAKRTLVNARTSSIGTAASTTLNTGIANTGDLVLACVVSENNAAPTGASDTTRGSWSGVSSGFNTGGNANTNLSIGSQYKIVTGQGIQTASFASLGTNWGLQTFVIKAG